jgi:hypothetical protein
MALQSAQGVPKQLSGMKAPKLAVARSLVYFRLTCTLLNARDCPCIRPKVIFWQRLTRGSLAGNANAAEGTYFKQHACMYACGDKATQCIGIAEERVRRMQKEPPCCKQSNASLSFKRKKSGVI